MAASTAKTLPMFHSGNATCTRADAKVLKQEHHECLINHTQAQVIHLAGMRQVSWHRHQQDRDELLVLKALSRMAGEQVHDHGNMWSRGCIHREQFRLDDTCRHDPVPADAVKWCPHAMRPPSHLMGEIL